jgi:hypothetical protein
MLVLCKKAGQELFTFTITFGKAFPLPRANENIRATKTIGRTGGWKFEKFGVGVSRPVPPPCGHFVKGVVIFPLGSRHYDNSQSL